MRNPKPEQFQDYTFVVLYLKFNMAVIQVFGNFYLVLNYSNKLYRSFTPCEQIDLNSRSQILNLKNKIPHTESQLLNPNY